MKKNDILRQAAQHKMPDIEQVRKKNVSRNYIPLTAQNDIQHILPR